MRSAFKRFRKCTFCQAFNVDTVLIRVDSFENVISSTPNNSLRLEFVSAVQDAEGPAENEVDEAPDDWCSTKITQILQNLKKPTSADIHPIVSHALTVGGLDMIRDV